MIHLINKGYELSGVEVSDSAKSNLTARLEKLRSKADLRSISEGKIPFEDGKFDVVIAWLVLYYNDWNGFHKAMDEINRVLKPGGVFLGTMCAVGDYSHSHSVLWEMECSDRRFPGKRSNASNRRRKRSAKMFPR